MKYFLITIIGILFFGCSTTIPPKSEYKMNPIMPQVSSKSLSCKAHSIKVAQAFSSNSLMSKDIYYTQGEYKQYIYSKSQWSIPPNRAISDMYLKLLRDTDLFNSVQISKSRSKNDFILEINIEDFSQYFDEDITKSHVNAEITLSLIESKSSIVFATKTFNSKIDVKNLSAQGGVNALNKALSDILYESNSWLEEVCK